jgi:hypothetical protein
VAASGHVPFHILDLQLVAVQPVAKLTKSLGACWGAALVRR